ncbi:MAG: hypothetical protein J6Y01_10615 [Spirochaetales bacterium]|nr:hypothetical protein [Spirochaetales bacterium]
MKAYDGLQIKIELANPKTFSQNDQIDVKISIVNKSKDEISCYIANDKKYSFNFRMMTMQNKVVPYKKDYLIAFNRIQPVFFNTLKLGPNEGYSYVVPLNEFFDITPGQYLVFADFYPNLKKNDNKAFAMVSNRLTVNIREKESGTTTIAELRRAEQGERLHVEVLSPDDIVRFMLKSRMNQQWDRFFLYLDLEKLILLNNVFAASYKRADVSKKQELIEEFKEYLKQNTIDTISYLPHNFRVVRTEYTEGRAKVEVEVEFKYIDYIEKKYYTYFFSKKGNIWYIDSYEVMNLGAK